MNTKQKDILNGQTSAEENGYNSKSGEQKNTELLKREKLEGSPFYIVGNEEEGYFLSLGKYRLTEPLPSIEKVVYHLVKEQWNITMKMILTIQQMIDENKEYLLEEETYEKIKDLSLARATKELNKSDKSL